MAKEFRVGIIISGDGKGAVQAAAATRAELAKLGRQSDTTSDRGRKMAAVYSKLNRDLGTTIRNAALAGAAITGLATRSVIRATLEQERAVTQLNQTLESTQGVAGLSSKELIDYAGSLQKVTNFGDEAIISMQSLLLTFTNLRGDEFKGATEAVLDMSTKLGTDLKAAALQVGKALNDPIKGVSALAEAGIQFSAQQQAVIKRLAETGDVAKAQQIILAELEVQFGGSARAARDTFGGALAGVKNAFGDLLEADGDSFPAVISSLGELEATLTDPNIQQGVASLVSGLVKVVEWSAKAAGAFADLGVSIGETFGEMTVRRDEADGLLDKLLAYHPALATLNFYLAQNGVETRKAAELAAEYGSVLEIVDPAFSGFLQNLVTGEGVMQRYAGAADDAVPPLLRVGQATGEVAAETENASDAIDKAAKARQRAVAQVEAQLVQLRLENAAIRAGVDLEEARTRARLEAQGVQADTIDLLIREQDENRALLEARRQDAEAATAAARAIQQANDQAARAQQEAYERAAGRIEQIYADTFGAIIRGQDNVFDVLLDSFRDVLAQMALEAARNAIVIPIVTEVGQMLGVGGDTLGGIIEALGGASGGGGLGGLMSVGSAQKDWERAIAGGAEKGTFMGIESAAPIFAAAAGNMVAFQLGEALGQRVGLSANVGGAAAVLSPDLALVNLATAGIVDELVSSIGGEWKMRSRDLSISIVDGMVDATITEFWRKDRPGRSDKKKTIEQEAAELDAFLMQTFGDVFESVTAAFGPDALNGFSFEFSESIKGKTEEEIQQILSDSIGMAMEDIALQVMPGIEAFQKGGEDLLNTLMRVATEIDTVELGFDRVGANLDIGNPRARSINLGPFGEREIISETDAINQALADTATRMIELVGGVQEFNSAIDSLIGFATPAQQTEILLGDLRRGLGDLADQLPATRSELFDLFGTLGPDAQATILANIDLLDDYYGAMEAGGGVLIGLAGNVRQALQDELANGGRTALQQQLAQLDRWYTDMREQAQGNTDDLLLIEQVFGERRQSLLSGALDAIESDFQQLANAIASASASIQSAILSIRRDSGNFDEVGYQSGVIGNLRSQLGTGSISSQVDTVNSLRQAIVSRYQAEVQQYEQAQQAQQQAFAQQQALTEEYQRQVAAVRELKVALIDLADSMLLSPESPLTNAERFAEAQSQFESAASAARGGDPEALRALQSAAQAFSRENASFFGSSDAGIENFGAIQSVLRDIGGSATRLPGPQAVVMSAPVSLATPSLDAIRSSAISQLEELDGILADLNAQAEEQAELERAQLQEQFDLQYRELQLQSTTQADMLVQQQAQTQAAQQQLAQAQQTNALLAESIAQSQQAANQARAQAVEMQRRNEQLLRELEASRSPNDVRAVA